MKLFNHLILYHPLLLLSSFFPSIRVFSNEMALCIRWPKYWSLSSFFPSIRVFSNEMALCIRWPKYWSFSTILPVNIQGWFPLGLTGLISLQTKGLSRIFSNTTVQKHQFFCTQLPLLWGHRRICYFTYLSIPYKWSYFGSLLKIKAFHLFFTMLSCSL